MEKIYDIRRILKVEYAPTENPKIFVWRSTLSEEGYPDIVTEGVGPYLPEPHTLTPKPCASSHNDPKEGGEWVLADAEILITLAKNEYAALDEDEDYLWQRYVLKTPYSDRERENIVLVRIFDYAHEVYGADGLPIPVALPFDYINGRITNDKYDLNEAVALLSRRSDCVGVTRRRIDYFNASEERYEAVEFMWQPSTEDYRRIHSYSSSWERYGAIRNLLGLVEKKK